MGKRSNFERNPRDYYPTPYLPAVPALLPFLRPVPVMKPIKFIEPMAGDGRLAKFIEEDGHQCVYKCDLEPQADGIEKRDVLFFDDPLPPCDMIITNPPWGREVLHASIERFVAHADTWLLFDADWAYTEYPAPYRAICKKIVAVGRVSWMGNGVSGFDNCSWYLFSNDHARYGNEAIFYFKR